MLQPGHFARSDHFSTVPAFLSLNVRLRFRPPKEAIGEKSQTEEAATIGWR